MNDNRTIRIMVFEPGRAPHTTMLEDSLEHRQELVGGDIECIPLPCETVLCCNASGKLAGLPENRQYGPDTIHGTFFLYGDTPEGRGVSLTDEQIAKYMDMARRTVNTRRHKAYRLLKELMGGEADA